MTKDLFVAAVAAAKPGERVLYHTGMLMADRVYGRDFMAIHATAREAFDLMEAGVVRLFQTKFGEGRYDYLAEKLAPPWEPVQWTGCYYTSPSPKRRRPRTVDVQVGPYVVRKPRPSEAGSPAHSDA